MWDTAITVNFTVHSYAENTRRRVQRVASDASNTYLYGLGRIARVNGTSTVFYHTDIAGSSRALTRWNGTTVVIEAAFSYEAFGRRTQGRTAPADYGFLFAGEPWDQKTGSYCPRAPYLCPQRQPGDIVFPPCYPCPIPVERSRSQSTSSAWPLGHHLGALRTARGSFRETNSS